MRTLWLNLVVLTLSTAANGGAQRFCDLAALARTEAAASNGRETTPPTIRALRLDGERIHVDGVLDDPAWERAEPAWGFRVWDPTRGGLPSEETVFKVAYDDDAIYVGVACLESDPSSIQARLSRRDDLHDSDIVSLYLDTYHDHTTGYNFRINAAGVKGDRYVYNDGEMDPDWDAVWDAEVSRDSLGWYAEFRIPFSCVRYRQSEEMTWGCNLWRYMHSLGEDTAWTVWDSQTRGFVSRFGELTGLRLVPAARQLELMPYAVGTVTDTSGPGSPDDELRHGNFGLDLKYGITSDFTLNAAIQPDFGQVEADPAVLNLSPFETRYQEKRPFFVEGHQFFEHPDFNVFYSRRIGMEGENARIRAAAKLTGKTSRGFSVAALYAATDVTDRGKAHQLFTSGERRANYLVGRLGKEFNEGAYRVNFMQTAVLRSADRETYGDFASRDAWTSAMDFDLNFDDRNYNIRGSFVGSAIDHAADVSDSTAMSGTTYGTGGRLELRKVGGTLMGGVSGHWETDKLDLNDAGFLSAPDEMSVGAWVCYEHHSDDSRSRVVGGEIGLSLGQSWLYAARQGSDHDTGEPIWSYERGHPQNTVIELESSAQFRNFWHAWCGGGWEPWVTSKYATRTYDDVRGPLMEYPPDFWGWAGFSTDYRQPVSFEFNVSAGGNERGAWNRSLSVGSQWSATDATTFSAALSYGRSHSEAQHLDNFGNPNGGIGGVSYVFAEMEQQTVDATLRADVLFARDLSLQFYAQPYLTVGDYHDPRELMRPDSYDLQRPGSIPGFAPDDVHGYDFRYASVNVNAVLRWEYMPGSTVFIVWKQGRNVHDERFDRPSLRTRLDFAALLENEPANEFLAKVTFWLPM
ncbi:MAG: carbohydrate binding family 9 domain-containing protein [Candidatus Eisenbacteria bacterium]|nr:carbohydrate binding family 9 domain-containing protein [Candidatus Eisenbacteria bacterium]